MKKNDIEGFAWLSVIIGLGMAVYVLYLILNNGVH
jgi:hypothetical protein